MIVEPRCTPAVADIFASPLSRKAEPMDHHQTAAIALLGKDRVDAALKRRMFAPDLTGELQAQLNHYALKGTLLDWIRSLGEGEADAAILAMCQVQAPPDPPPIRVTLSWPALDVHRAGILAESKGVTRSKIFREALKMGLDYMEQSRT